MEIPNYFLPRTILKRYIVDYLIFNVFAFKHLKEKEYIKKINNVFNEEIIKNAPLSGDHFFIVPKIIE